MTILYTLCQVENDSGLTCLINHIINAVLQGSLKSKTRIKCVNTGRVINVFRANSTIKKKVLHACTRTEQHFLKLISIHSGHREPKSRPTWVMDGLCEEASWQLASKMPEKEATTGTESNHTLLLIKDLISTFLSYLAMIQLNTCIDCRAFSRI